MEHNKRISIIASLHSEAWVLTWILTWDSYVESTLLKAGARHHRGLSLDACDFLRLALSYSAISIHSFPIPLSPSTVSLFRYLHPQFPY